MTDLLGLANRVERYAPSGHHDLDRDRERELNEAIGLAVGVGHRMKVGDIALGNDRWVPTPLRPYVTSLDAAMTLIPDEYDWAVFHTNGGLTIHAWCGSRDDVFGATPALALTAAALRARNHLNQEASNVEHQ